MLHNRLDSEQQGKLQLFSSSKCKLRTDAIILPTYRGNRNSLAEGSSEYMRQRCVSKKRQEAQAGQRDLKQATYYLL